MERERQAKERWKRKYQKIKSLFTAAEMEREVIDIMAMAAPPPPLPPPPLPATDQSKNFFYKIIRSNEKMFVTLLGVPFREFDALLQEVCDVYNVTTMDRQRRKR